MTCECDMSEGWTDDAGADRTPKHRPTARAEPACLALTRLVDDGAAPQLRSIGEPEPTIASDGTAVVRYPFEFRARGNRVRLRATVEIMSSDGGQVESEAPMGTALPAVRAWIDPSGGGHPEAELEPPADGADGRWALDVELLDDAMMRVDVRAEAV